MTVARDDPLQHGQLVLRVSQRAQVYQCVHEDRRELLSRTHIHVLSGIEVLWLLLDEEAPQELQSGEHFRLDLIH